MTMLVRNKQNEIVTIKLVSGEEVVGRFVEEDKGTIQLKKPVVPVATGENQVALAPFVMSGTYLNKGADDVVGFNMTTVVAVVKTHEEFANLYTQQTSGLDLSNEKKSHLIT